MLYINEACISCALFGDESGMWFAAHTSGCSEQVIAPSVNGAAFFVGTVVGMQVVVSFLPFAPAAGLGKSVETEIT